MKFSIIIPCYNEARNMNHLLERIRPLQNQYNLEFILVENGSADNSKEYFEQGIVGRYEGIKVVFVDVNRGYGYGLQQGIKAASGDYIGWIHADLQIQPEELIPFFDEVNRANGNEKLFLKGRRLNRSAFDRFFTIGQSVFNTFLFKTKLYDVGAIPVLFHKTLISDMRVDEMPNDFSIELFIYREAVRKGYTIKRFKVKLLTREEGNSSWNQGFKSKIKQSKRIFNDSIKIKRGEKVL